MSFDLYLVIFYIFYDKFVCIFCYFFSFSDEKLSDVSFSGTRSFISLDPINFDPSKFNIDLEIRPLSDKGLILFIGQKEKSFLSLSIQSSLLEVRILPGKLKTLNN